MELLTSTVVQTMVLLEVRPNKFAKRMIEMIVTLDAKYLLVRDPNSSSSPDRMNPIDTEEEQHTGHHKQIRQSRLTFG